MDSYIPLLKKAKEEMEKVLLRLKSVFAKFQVGKVSREMIAKIAIPQDGGMTTLEKVAVINPVSATILEVKPWDKHILTTLHKEITKQNHYDFTIHHQGDLLRLHRAPLTQEARQKLVKEVSVEAESGRILIRNQRKKIKQEAKSLTAKDEIKQAENKLQELTNDYIKKINNLYERKAEEIMKI